jgi:hypothetical protein
LNRYDVEPNLDDALGRAIRWSLRGSVAHAAPSAQVWARIKQRAYANEGVAAAEAHKFALRSRRTVEIIRLVRLRRAAGRLLRLCAATWRVLDEHTMSSEMVWRPETTNDARGRLMSQCIGTWPLCGQLLPTY